MQTRTGNGQTRALGGPMGNGMTVLKGYEVSVAQR